MAEKTTAINWQKLMADLQALKAGGVAIANILQQILKDFVSRSEDTRKRGVKPVQCDPECFKDTLSYLEEQRKNLTDAMCDNLCVTYDIEKCCGIDDGDSPF